MSIYLDHAATTPLRPEVLEVMLPHLTARGSNPSGMYESARDAKRALEAARRTVARCIGSAPSEIYFTSGGTESNNWALRCLLRQRSGQIITSQAEHPSVLYVLQALEKEGRKICFLPVDAAGRVDIWALRQALQEETALVSVMYANNEVGAVSPIAEISALCGRAGVPFHTDAVAAAGKVPIDVHAQGIDMLSASAHKFYGPRGMGFLYLSDEIAPAGLFQGGHQERSLRPGTENVAGAVGMAEALRLCCAEQSEEYRRLTALRSHLLARLANIPGLRINGDPKENLPSLVHLTLPGIRSESALIFLDGRKIACGAGAACSVGAERASHVLLAMGQPEEEAACALRISFGRGTRQEDLDELAAALGALINAAERRTAAPV